MVRNMAKYSKTITLETLDSFHPIKFTVSEADSVKDADKELLKWVKDYPELMKIPNNKKILEWTLNDK